MTNQVFADCGTTIFETMSQLAQRYQAINLGQGFPEGLEPQEVIQSAIAALQQGPHQYPPMAGLPVLRQAVSDNARRFLGLAVDWEREVLITSGASEALADAIFALFNPGDEVLLFEPAYDSYQPILRRAGLVPVPVRLRPPHWELPFDELQRAVTGRTRGLILNTPMNPIGKVFLADELRALANLMLEHDLIAIADEVYEHLWFDDQRHLSLFALPDVRDRVVRIGSAGKSFSLTGWKVGYVTADVRLLTPIMRAHQYITFTTPPALQSAVAFGLCLPDDYFHHLRAQLQTRRDFFVSGLNDCHFYTRKPAATYFAVTDVADLDPDGDDVGFCRRLTQEAGVTALPISAFYTDASVRRYIRFCFAKQQQTLASALERLALWSVRR